METNDLTHDAAILPRVSAKYFITPDLALSVGGGDYQQWLHSLGRSEEVFQPMQFWVPPAAGVGISHMHDFTLGVEKWTSATSFLHAGPYFKKYDRVLTPNLLSDPRVHGDEYVPLTGKSYGVDFLWRELNAGDFSGWLSYSYAFNTRQTADGFSFFPTQDRRHTLNMVGSWHDGPVTFGAHFSYATGTPFTPALASFVRDRYDAVARRWITDSQDQNITAGFNSERLPYYSRIDVSMSHEGHLFGIQASPYVSILNVLNASNPAGYVYSATKQERASIPNLPFAPTAGITFRY
jgi:hypothetical protein